MVLHRQVAFIWFSCFVCGRINAKLCISMHMVHTPRALFTVIIEMQKLFNSSVVSALGCLPYVFTSLTHLGHFSILFHLSSLFDTGYCIILKHNGIKRFLSFLSSSGIRVSVKVKLAYFIIWRGSRDRCKSGRDCQKSNTMSFCVCACISSGCPCSITRPCVRCTHTLSAMPVHFSAYVHWYTLSPVYWSNHFCSNYNLPVSLCSPFMVWLQPSSGSYPTSYCKRCWGNQIWLLLFLQQYVNNKLGFC